MMPDARLKLIPRAGHFVMIEKAAEVNDEIKSFMSAK
jgi:pimeloyl-ACP methyl ester carboxylesterase